MCESFEGIYGSFAWFPPWTWMQWRGPVVQICTDLNSHVRKSQKSLILPQKRPIFPRKRPIFPPKISAFPLKSPVFSQKSPVFPQTCPVFLQKSPIFLHKSTVFPQKSLILPTKSPVYPRWASSFRKRALQEHLLSQQLLHACCVCNSFMLRSWFVYAVFVTRACCVGDSAGIWIWCGHD